MERISDTDIIRVQSRADALYLSRVEDGQLCVLIGVAYKIAEREMGRGGDPFTIGFCRRERVPCFAQVRKSHIPRVDDIIEHAGLDVVHTIGEFKRCADSVEQQELVA